MLILRARVRTASMCVLARPPMFTTPYPPCPRRLPGIASPLPPALPQHFPASEYGVVRGPISDPRVRRGFTLSRWVVVVKTSPNYTKPS